MAFNSQLKKIYSKHINVAEKPLKIMHQSIQTQAMSPYLDGKSSIQS